jgi:hypothetical protein
MTVLTPHFTHGGGGGWNGSDMTPGSLMLRRELEWSLSQRRLERLPMMLQAYLEWRRLANAKLGQGR